MPRLTTFISTWPACAAAAAVMPDCVCVGAVMLDCAGMTKSGKQETPEWLQKVLGVEVPKVEGQGQTLEQLLGPKPE